MKNSTIAALFAVTISPLAAAAPPFGGEEMHFDRDTSAYKPLSIYGDFRYSLVANDQVNDSGLDTEDNHSRLGIGGTLGGVGNSAVFYNISFINKSDTGGSDSVRDIYAGFRGGWGEVFAGKRRTIYAEVTRWIDPFYDTSTASSRTGANFGASGYTDSAQGINEAFQNDQIGYRSPRFGPFSFNVALFSDDETVDDNIGFELGTAVGFGIGNGGRLGFSLNVLANGDTATVNGIAADNFAIKFASGMEWAGFGVGAQLEHLEVDGNSRDPYYGTLAGWVPVRHYGRIALSVALQQNAVLDGGTPNTTFKAHGTQDGWAVNLGYFGYISDNLDFNAQFSYVDISDTSQEVFAVSVGARFRFNVNLI